MYFVKENANNSGKSKVRTSQCVKIDRLGNHNAVQKAIKIEMEIRQAHM